MLGVDSISTGLIAGGCGKAGERVQLDFEGHNIGWQSV